MSRFGGEDEQLFMGGFYRIKIQSIQDIDTNEETGEQSIHDYETYLEPLGFLECMLSGIDIGKQNKPEFTVEAYALCQLIDHKLKVAENPFPKYINDTFAAFVAHKTELILNPHYIHEYFRELSGLIMEPMVQKEKKRKKKRIEKRKI